MILYVNGCSFTYGLGLKNPENDCWSALLSQRLKADLINDGKASVSNLYMFRKTLNFLLQNKHLHKDLFVIIGWTTFQRTEYYYNNKLQKNVYVCELNIFNDLIRKKIPGLLYNKNIFSNNNIFDILSKKLANEYLLHIKDTLSYSYIHTMSIILKILDIKYVFFNAYYDMLFINCITKSFYNFCKENNYALDETSHPLEEGHEEWAEYLYQYIKENNML